MSLFREAFEAEMSRDLAQRWTEEQLDDFEFMRTEALHGCRDIFAHAFGPEHSYCAMHELNAGETLAAEGAAKAALERYQRALQIWEKAHGRDHET